MSWAAFGVWASSTAAPSSRIVIPSRQAVEPVATKILISPTRAANARFSHPLHTLTASNGTQGSLDTSTSYVISTSVRQCASRNTGTSTPLPPNRVEPNASDWRSTSPPSGQPDEQAMAVECGAITEGRVGRRMVFQE